LVLSAVGAGFGVEALVGQAEALDGATMDEVLFDNFRCVFRTHTAIPDGIGVDDDHGAVFALVQAAGFVDTHTVAETCGFGALLEFRVQVAGSIGGAGGTRCADGTGVVTDKDMVFKGWHGFSP
jgi:hypothetical protein